MKHFALGPTSCVLRLTTTGTFAPLVLQSKLLDMEELFLVLLYVLFYFLPSIVLDLSILQQISQICPSSANDTTWPVFYTVSPNSGGPKLAVTITGMPSRAETTFKTNF